MRHITTLFMMLALVLGTFASLTAQNMTAKEQRKLTRQERKIAQQKENERLYKEAIRALENNNFVLEAHHLIFKRGRSTSVSATRNFISMANKKATVQVSFDTPRPLQNGLGGFTVEGNVSDVKMKTEKNGSVIYSFYVQGVSISAYVTISLSPGSNNVSARISPSFNSNTLTMMGKLLPQEKASIFEGIKR
ncbi:DUF4251 domain-containing protein [Butyricimonas hominis]|uniref:DUF4251 domain-containing protein n=1 Tax=Butyricimonas hominis TaxID=2763032 RepID=A0ABR7D161_9BACT|nr:DUF4251 domain-containing protein [Butyricimonas hominis]MBC5621677.1 DUF4251 domain-containing protein [Butyricimonas hominis]